MFEVAFCFFEQILRLLRLGDILGKIELEPFRVAPSAHLHANDEPSDAVGILGASRSDMVSCLKAARSFAGAIYIDRYINSAREVGTVMPCAQVPPPRLVRSPSLT